jgi:molybdopterin molybdotransferase
MEDMLVEPETIRCLIAQTVPALPPRPVPLLDVAGLVLTAPVVAPFNLPRFTNAAMDGFALASADTLHPPTRLRIVGRSLAGAPSERSVGSGETVAIATGAMLPTGADTVVPIEEVELDGLEVLIPTRLVTGRHVRQMGEDMAAGQLVLAVGTVLGPGQLAALASLGLHEVVAHPRPHVAIVPTGDEIRPAGSRLEEGQAYDAVSVPLAALVAEAGAVATLQPPAGDDPERLMSALRQAAHHADAIFTVGGVSVGDRDLISRLGGPVAVRAFRVALRPARPFAFGQAFGKPLLCLPGNPASALAAFEEFGWPAILGMLGKPPGLRPAVRAVLAEPLTRTPGILHLVRATVWREGGRLWARSAGQQGAAMMHSLAQANAWAVIPSGTGELPAGSEIDVRMFGEA